MDRRKLCYWCEAKLRDAGFTVEEFGVGENGKCDHCRKKRWLNDCEVKLAKGKTIPQSLRDSSLCTREP